jgi:hypothetical protein
METRRQAQIVRWRIRYSLLILQCHHNNNSYTREFFSKNPGQVDLRRAQYEQSSAAVATINLVNPQTTRVSSTELPEAGTDSHETSGTNSGGPSKSNQGIDTKDSKSGEHHASK